MIRMVLISLFVISCRASDDGTNKTINDSLQSESRLKFIEQTDPSAFDNTITALQKKHRAQGELSSKEYFELARLFAAKSEWAKAKLYTAYGVQKDPKGLNGILCQTELALRENRIAKAESILRERETAGQKDASWQNLLGIIHYRNQRFDAAIVAWEEARKLNPERQDVRLNLAQLQLKLGRFKDVDIQWLSAESELGAYPIAAATRASAFSQRGSGEEALSEYAKPGAINVSAQTQYNYALAEWRSENTQAAKDRIESAVNQKDLDPELKQKLRRLLAKFESLTPPTAKKTDSTRKES
jgi:Flp pilus assembly protein TadD